MRCVEFVLLLQQPQHSTRSSQSSLTWGLSSITTAAVRASRCRKQGEHTATPTLQSCQCNHNHNVILEHLTEGVSNNGHTCDNKYSCQRHCMTSKYHFSLLDWYRCTAPISSYIRWTSQEMFLMTHRTTLAQKLTHLWSVHHQDDNYHLNQNNMKPGWCSQNND
jgi:hypothetical protein